MRALLALITLLVMSQTTVWGQVVVGIYHLSSTGKDYSVVVDDMQNRYKGKHANRELKKCQIYLQVESYTAGTEAYLKLSSGDATGFVKELSKNLSKGRKQHKSTIRKQIGNAEAELYMKRPNEISGIPIYGYESGQDYDIFYEQNMSGQWFLSYLGEYAKSEGNDGLTISGWSLIISNQEEIQVIGELLQKAQTMIKNNRAEL